MPIYIVKHGDAKRLVRASTQHAARSFVARDQIHVEVAGPDDIYEMARSGRVIEEADNKDRQTQIGESV